MYATLTEHSSPRNVIVQECPEKKFKKIKDNIAMPLSLPGRDLAQSDDGGDSNYEEHLSRCSRGDYYRRGTCASWVDPECGFFFFFCRRDDLPK